MKNFAKILALGVLGYFLFSSFKKKEDVPGTTTPDDPTTPPSGAEKWITFSQYSKIAAHPLAGQVPLFVKRFYTEKHMNSPFTSVSIKQNGLPAYVTAYTNMLENVEVKIYEEAEYQPGRSIVRITNFTQENIPEDRIIQFLQYPDKYTRMYFDKNGITVPLKSVPASTPYSLNLWVLKENLRNAALNTSLNGRSI